MLTTHEPTETPLPPVHQYPPRCIIDNLRAVADWLERHNVAPKDVICGSGDKWDAMVQLHIAAARKLWPNRMVMFDHGHANFEDEGVRVTVTLDTTQESHEVTL